MACIAKWREHSETIACSLGHTLQAAGEQGSLPSANASKGAPGFGSPPSGAQAFASSFAHVLASLPRPWTYGKQCAVSTQGNAGFFQDNTGTIQSVVIVLYCMRIVCIHIMIDQIHNITRKTRSLRVAYSRAYPREEAYRRCAKVCVR